MGLRVGRSPRRDASNPLHPDAGVGNDVPMGDEQPTFRSAPPERIDLPLGLALARCDPARTAAAVTAINESLEHLRPWMAWAAKPATEASIGTFFAAATELWDQRKAFEYSIIEASSQAVIGGCGLLGRLGPDGLEIGYWVHVDWAGRGVATAAARALVDAAFEIEGIQRIRIQCEEKNLASARVPEKLGFRFQGLGPGFGPCEGRPTQIWMLERADWAGATAPSP
jgi:RimJ/RimL family protein N-acetyltransferase